MRRSRYTVFLLVLRCILHVQLFAVISSDYVQQTPLQFAYGPPTVLQAFSSADTYILSTHFTALLGTLTISSDGQLFDPALVDMEIDINLTIEGYVRPNSTSIQFNTQIPVYIRAVSVAKNKVIKSAIIVGNHLTLGKNPGNVLGGTDSLYVYLVLVNEPTIADYFVPGTIYRLTDASTVGTFDLEAADSGGNTAPIEIPISVNGSAPAPDAPFIGSGSGDVPDIPYEGDFDFDHYFNFSILSTPASFILSEAIADLRPTIASLQLQVLNAEINTEYGVQIAFSSKNPQGFTLHLDGNLAYHGIPYRLFLGNEEIMNNELTIWRGLQTQSNSFATAQKDVTVLISATDMVDSAPERIYQDTVTVIIIPLDTL